MTPLWAYVAGGLAVVTASFGAGWTVRDWKSDADAAEAQQAIEQADLDLRAAQDAAAVFYEGSRDALDRTSSTTRTIIRERFREIPVPAVCAVPEPVVDGLRDSIRATNAAVAGGSASALPATP